MQPSTARTVLAGTTYGLPPRGRQATAAVLTWPNRSPAQLLDYSVDFTALLDDTTDTLASAFASISTPPVWTPPPPPQWQPPATPLAGWFTYPPPPVWTPPTPEPCPTPPTPSGTPLAINSVALAGNVATLFLANGVPETSYLVTVLAYSVAGRQLAAVVGIYVNTDAPLASPATPSSTTLGVDLGPFAPLTPGAPSQTIAANAGTPLQLAPWPNATGGTVEVANTTAGDIYVAFGASNTVTASSANGYLVASGITVHIAVLGTYTWVAIAGTTAGLVRITQGTGGS